MFSTRLPGVVHFNTTRVCMGEAAGTAAALAKETGVAIADVDTDVLRTTLHRNGAFVG